MSLALGLAVAKFAFDAYGNKKKRDALAGMKKLTPEEASYKKKLTELSTKGDPDINKIRNRRISAVRQVGADTQQKITGDLIQSGMENSVVSSELRRKAGADVMRQVATESQKIAEKNRQFKKQHSDRLDKYNLDRSQYLKQLSAKQDEIPTWQESAVSHAVDFGAGELTKIGTKSAQKFELMKSAIACGDYTLEEIEEMMKGLL